MTERESEKSNDWRKKRWPINLFLSLSPIFIPRVWSQNQYKAIVISMLLSHKNNRNAQMCLISTAHTLAHPAPVQRHSAKPHISPPAISQQHPIYSCRLRSIHNNSNNRVYVVCWPYTFDSIWMGNIQYIYIYINECISFDHPHAICYVCW